MFRKYAPDSPWNESSKGHPKVIADAIKGQRRLGQAVFKRGTSRRLTEAGRHWNTKSGAIKVLPADRFSRASENVAWINKNKKLTGPGYRAMREADIAANLEGVHSDYHKKLDQLVATHNDWKKTGRGGWNPKTHTYEDLKHGETSPLHAIRQHMKDYRKEIQSNRPNSPWRGYGQSLLRKRGNIRKAMTQELLGNREIIQAKRAEQGTLPRPLSAKKMRQVKARKLPNVGATLPTKTEGWNHGIESATPEVRTHVRIAGKWHPREEFKSAIVDQKRDIESAVNSRITQSSRSALQIDQALQKKARIHIQKLRTTAGLDPYRESDLQRQIHQTVKPIYGQTSIEGVSHAAERNANVRRSAAVKQVIERGKGARGKKLGTRAKVEASRAISAEDVTAPASQAEHIASRLGIKPHQVGRIQDRYRTLTTWSQSHAGEQAIRGDIRRKILKEGKVFKPEVPAAEAAIRSAGYPALKKVLKGGGVVAGAAGAGYLIHRALRKKNGKNGNGQPETQFSAVDGLFKKISSSTRRRLVEGGALTGGIAAADAAVSATHPDPDKNRKQSAWAGAKRGTLYGAVLAGTEQALRKPLHKILLAAKKDEDNPVRDIAIGGVEGGAGVLATDRLIKRFAPEGSPLRRKVLIGAGVGGLATGAIGYGINRLLRKRQNQTTQLSALQFARGDRVRRLLPTLTPPIGGIYKKHGLLQKEAADALKNFKLGKTSSRASSWILSNQRSLIQFRVTRSARQVLSDGSRIDILALNRLVQDRPATRIKMKSLKPMAYTKKSGFSERRVKNANTQKPILVHRGEVVDGRHRITKKQRLGHTTASAIQVTAKDLKAVKMNSRSRTIQFQDNRQPRARRPVVAVDRYRKQIKDREIMRHESNVAKSAAAGAALSGILGHKLLPGAIAGTAVSSGLIAANRKKKDVFGEAPISIKREERLPYQAAGLTAAGILAHKIYRKFGVNGNSHGRVIRFERKKKPWLERAADSPQTYGERLYVYGNRARKIARDAKLKKTQAGNVVDERGRERTPEWKRPWAYRAAAVAGIGAVLGRKELARRITHSAVGERIGEALKQRAPAVVKAHEQAKDFVHSVKTEYKDVQNRALNKVLPAKSTEVEKAKKAAIETEEARKIREKARGVTEGKFSSRTSPIRFADSVPDWDIRDARGKSVRVYAPGSQRRSRREKKWHEKKSNRDLLATGLITAALGGGASTIPLYQKLKQRGEALPVKPIHVSGTKIKGVIEGKTAGFVKKASNLFKLSQTLDTAIALEEPIGVAAVLKHLKNSGLDHKAYAKRRLAEKSTSGKSSLALLDYLRGRKPVSTPKR